MRAVILSVLAAGTAACNSSSGGVSDYPRPCPSVAPEAGTRCPQIGLWCEYGSDPNVACDQLYNCSFSWEALGVDAGLACDPSVERSCQPTYDMQKSVATTGSCAPTGLLCSFAEGTCACVPPGTPSLDGGPKTQSAQFICVDLPSGCPFPRPRLGDGCATERQACDYAGCVAASSKLVCVNHAWALDLGCP